MLENQRDALLRHNIFGMADRVRIACDNLLTEMRIEEMKEADLFNDYRLVHDERGRWRRQALAIDEYCKQMNSTNINLSDEFGLL